MAVTFVVGNFPAISVHLFDPGTTITSTIANEFGEADTELEYSALIALAFILLVVDFFVLWLAKGVLLGKAKKYNV